jgi:hypothetical protein
LQLHAIRHIILINRIIDTDLFRGVYFEDALKILKLKDQTLYIMKALRSLFLVFIMLGFAVSAFPQGTQVERPMKGRFLARVVESYPTYEILSIDGYASHLGLVLNSQMKFVRPTATTPPYIEGIIRAANGDYYNFYSWPILVVTDPAKLSGNMFGTVYISNGSGRFAGCYGQGQMTGTFSMSEDWAQWTVDGTITY